MHYCGDISERYSVSRTLSAERCRRHIVAEPATGFIARDVISALAGWGQPRLIVGF